MLKDILKDINALKDEHIIVGVSAGPDSMMLLHLLMNNTNKKIVCCHINHNIRYESAEEELYLKKYCHDNNIIFECMTIDGYQSNNFENEARIKRYHFYEKILKKYHSHTLLLAHHGDDLIETIIMKIIRGSNLEGYAGIKTYSHLENYTIIRPLLSLTKDDILKYNHIHNIRYYIDNTNSDTTYTRNRYRANILPILKREDEDVHLKFLKYSNTIQEYYNYIEDITKEKLQTTYKNNTIDITAFKNEHPFMQKNIIFYILSSIYNNESNIIKDKHIESIIHLIYSDKPNQSINLPKNFIVQREYNQIHIERNKNIQKNKDYIIPLKEYNLINNIIIKQVSNIDTDGNDVCRLNSKDIKLPLYLRNRKSGDTISVLGLNNTKKVKDIFINEKIPLEIRDTYPLLVDANNNILWIPFIKKSKYNVKNGESCDIILTSYKESEENNEEKN